MRKLKLFFACLLMAVLSIGQVWGDSYTITLKSSTGTSDSSSGMTSTTVADYVADGASYVSAVAPSGKVYLAKSDCGIKFGNSSGGGSLTFTLATAVKPTSIVVYASQFGASEGKGIFQGEEFDMTGGGGKYVFNNYTVEYDGNTSVTTISVGAQKRGYVKSITVNFGGSTPPPSCTSEITITKADDPANGTFALDNSGTVCIDEGNATVNVTATPADHYHLASVTTTGSVGTIGTISGNTCEITDIDADTEIGVTFAEDDKVKVTWNVNGDETLKTDVYVGEKPAFPATPSSCSTSSTTFIGWATAPWTGKVDDLSEKTVYTSASAMPEVNTAVTYYAVFANIAVPSSNLFSWAGGSSTDLAAEEGVEALSADNKDYADDTYKVKWNGTGKYIIISVASQPGQVSAGFKMIGGNNTSTITVQEADDADGPFTDVENLAISGETDDVVNIVTTQAFKASTRAIKLYYTKGSNVGLGPISIESPVSYADYLTTCGCEKLGTPSVTVPAANLTHNSAKLTWAAIDNADKYLVKINGVDQEATSNLYFDATDLTPETQYTYQVKALPAANQDDYCEGDFSEEANFTTNEAPKAHLTLIDIEGTHASSGDYAVGIPFNLPTMAASCSKTFVGWDPDDECATEPTYAKGAPFTFADQTDATLYAVYATAANVTATFNAGEYAEANNWQNGTAYSGFEIDGVTFTAVGGGNNGKYYTSDATWRFYDGGGSVSVSAAGNILSVSSNPSMTFTINGTSASAAGAAKYKSITVTVEGSYSNYSTTCAAPLDAPTFALNPEVIPVDGKYLEAINVTISATDGDIYYNINSADDPTSGSTPYTGAIEINSCGSTTIKAIAISSTSQSPVASATYVLNLPIPSVSAEDPYTEAEAVQVYNSGCYDNEDVWVTGTVKTAQFYSSNTYTITLTNDFQFYYFYESFDGENLVPFTEDYIVAGDVLVAKGKLSKHNTTYQIANGYLVSRTPASKEPIDSDIDNPLSVAAAINYIDNAATYDLSEDEYVAGIVESIAECPQHEGTYDIIVLDATDNTKQMKFFGCDVKTFAGIKQYDQITGKGKLFKYYSTYELNYPCEVAALTPYVAPVVDVTGVEVDETATVMVGKTVQLTATVAPEGATNKNVAWSVKEGDEAYAEVSATGLVTGLAEGEATIIVTTEDGGFTDECVVTVNPIPYWATVYDNNVAVVHGGTSGVDNGTITISETAYKLVKAGASSKTGTIIVTVPAGATDLHFHAFAWGGTTSKIQIAGVDNPSISVFDLAGESGAAGSGNDFTLAGDPVDQYFHVSFDAVANTTEIEFSKADGSADNRFFLYGVNQVGGDFGSYQRPTTSGNYGTICLPYAGTISGAMLFEIANYENDMIYCDEIIDGKMIAGRPYIFYATSGQLNVAYTANVEAAAGNHNGLYGFYDLDDENAQFDIEENAGNYILYSNAYWLVKGRAAYIANYRAYIKLSQINNTGAQAPGRRRVAMAVNGEQVVTGIDALNAAEAPVKMIIDGQLFIIRGEKMYNANGQLVK